MANDTYPYHPDIAPAITEDMWAEIDDILNANRTRPGSLISVLRLCQDIVGYLPVDLLDYIGRGLNLSQSKVFGVATFYSLFSLEPKGRHTIKVCLGTACYVKGIREIISRIENEYHVKKGGTTRDRRFSVETVRCLGACGLAPVTMVDHDLHGSVSSDKILDIIDDYQ